MISEEAYNIIKQLFKSLFTNYQENLENKMKGSGLILNHVKGLFMSQNKFKSFWIIYRLFQLDKKQNSYNKIYQ